MRCPALILCATLAACAGASLAVAQSAAQAPSSAQAASPAEEPAPAPPSAAEERLVISGDGSRLSQNHGGGGGSLTWLSTLDSGHVVGLGGEYQAIANSHWTLGYLTGSATFGQPSAKLSLYAEAHEGAGDVGTHAFHYSIIDGGVIGTLGRVSVQLEERRIDIDTSHGHLPKIGLSLRLTQQLLASVSYARSFGGDLGTKLTTVRLDYVSKSFTWLAGGDWGPAAPAVIDLVGQVVKPGPSLREEFLGIGMPLGHTEWLLVGDHQDLEGFKRTTVTLTCTVHFRAGG
jgi:hypothetical protein